MPRQQLHSQLFFEQANLRPQCWLRHVKLLRGTADISGLDDFDEIT